MLGNVCTFPIIGTYRFIVPADLIKFDRNIGKLLSRIGNVFLIFFKCRNIVFSHIRTCYKGLFPFYRNYGKVNRVICKVKICSYIINALYLRKRGYGIFLTVNVHGLLVDIHINGCHTLGLRILCKLGFGYLYAAESA